MQAPTHPRLIAAFYPEKDIGMKWTKGEYTVTDDQKEMDISLIHEFLSSSYWAKGIDKKTVERSMANSICLGVFHKGIQLGFGRVITDQATFAYLADVFVLPEYRGMGLGKWLVGCFLGHEKLQGLRQWLLKTADAHDLYKKHGFTPLQYPGSFMELKPKQE